MIRQSEPGSWGAPVKQCACLTIGWVDDHTIAVGSFTIAQGRPVGRTALHDVVSGGEHLLFEFAVGPDMPQGGTISSDRRSVIYKTSEPSGRSSIWNLPIDGGPRRLLMRFTNPDRPTYRANVAASRTHLYFTIDDRQSDIAVAELTKR